MTRTTGGEECAVSRNAYFMMVWPSFINGTKTEHLGPKRDESPMNLAYNFEVSDYFETLKIACSYVILFSRNLLLKSHYSKQIPYSMRDITLNRIPKLKIHALF